MCHQPLVPAGLPVAELEHLPRLSAQARSECFRRVIGKSDRAGARPVSTAYTPFDVGATIYAALGSDPESEIRDAQNRPSRVCTGKSMDVLFRNE